MNIKALFCALYVIVFYAFSCSAQYYSQVSVDSMALVKASVACLRTFPGHSQELSSQLIMGTPVKVLGDDGSWYYVETPEGSTGYMIHNAVKRLSVDEYKDWRESDRIFVTGVNTRRLRSENSDYPISDVFSGSVLKITSETPEKFFVETPDKRQGWIPKSEAISLSALSDIRVDSLISRARQLTGVSYLWGGTTPAAVDCSGFVKVLYLSEGLILRRDANQQAETGNILDSDFTCYRPGDLIFFKSATTGNINHVGMYIGDGNYIHSAGRVKINSLNPESPLFIRSNILAGARRIIGQENTPGITSILSHPWFVPTKHRD